MIYYKDEFGSARQTSRCLLFSSLPKQVSNRDLEAYCDLLGESIEVESMELFDDGKAKAVVSGLTIEGIVFTL